MIRCWRLDDSRQTLVLGSAEERLPEILYWGARLPDHEDLETIYRASRLDVTGGMVDENAELSICPAAARTFPGQPGLEIASPDGRPIWPNFDLVEVDQTENTLSVTAADKSLGIRYRAAFELDIKTGVLSSSAELETDTPVQLHWLAAPVFPASQSSREMIEFSGRWIGEFQIATQPWSVGARVRENRLGRTDHAHFPGLIVPAEGCVNTRGEAQAFHYGWSGGHRMVAEEFSDGRRQVQFGHMRGAEPELGTHFATATLYAVWSDAGLNGIATGFQRHLRDRLVQWPTAPTKRPVHYNCWEAVYFDHKLDELKAIADQAAALGAERFVLDDGWFGRRDDDTSSLGDWTIDARKYPDGLAPLVAHVRALGMGFGIWFEPEMINENSDLFRAHPDWVLGPLDQIRGRQQLVLNMALPEVRDYLFDHIAAVLSSAEIEYIKWDHNRVLPVSDAAQTRGTYALLERIRTAFPRVEIESCSSGGGRIDFGILEQTQRVWLSDSNDALERLKIQHNAALFLPFAVTGSHVGPRRCHTSGRVHDIRFRAWVAAQRHLGFEMDPRELTEEEAEVLSSVTAWWKQNRAWLARADILRLDSDDLSLVAEEQLDETGTQFVVFAARAETSRQSLPCPLRLTALDPKALYEITLVNAHEAHHLSRGAPALKSGPVTLSGAYLMTHGIALPWSFPDRMWVLQGKRQ